MALTKLNLTPDQTGYSVQDGEETIAVQLDGGQSRYRTDVLGATSKVRVQWTIGHNDYYYLRAFYRTTTNRGSLPFLIDLIMDEPVLTEHEVHFVPGSMRLTRQRGATYTIRAELEVTPAAIDTDFDEAVVMIYGNYGVDSNLILASIEELVNAVMPDTIGE